MISRDERGAQTHSDPTQDWINRARWVAPQRSEHSLIEKRSVPISGRTKTRVQLIRHASIRTYSAFVEAACTLGFSVSGWCCNLSVGLEGPGKTRSHREHGIFLHSSWFAASCKVSWPCLLRIANTEGLQGGQSLGVNPSRCTELNWTENIKVESLTVTALPARHFSGRSLFGRFETLWASFALTSMNHCVYYGADSGEWYGFRDIGESFGPFNLRILEIGASDPLWPDIHMGSEGAVRSFRALDVGGHGLLMPSHWGLFDLAPHHWRQPIENMFAVQDLKLWSPEPGTPYEVVQDQEIRWR
jgi:Beta-lactamase superfamily domain